MIPKSNEICCVRSLTHLRFNMWRITISNVDASNLPTPDHSWPVCKAASLDDKKSHGLPPFSWSQRVLKICSKSALAHAHIISHPLQSDTGETFCNANLAWVLYYRLTKSLLPGHEFLSPQLLLTGRCGWTGQRFSGMSKVQQVEQTYFKVAWHVLWHVMRCVLASLGHSCWSICSLTFLEFWTSCLVA